MSTSADHLTALRESIRAEEREALKNEIRQEILTNLGQALGGATTPPPNGVRSVRKAMASKGVTLRKTVKPGAKRSPEDIAKTATAVLAAVVKTPGIGAEGIKTALSTELSSIELPIKKLLASKQIKKRGQKRATKYYPVAKNTSEDTST